MMAYEYLYLYLVLLNLQDERKNALFRKILKIFETRSVGTTNVMNFLYNYLVSQDNPARHADR
jgi:hypothetical protein